jgi:hypothetical protein
MAEKAEMLAHLGEAKLLLPQLVARALSANDRVKYFLTLLQTARAHADTPESEASDLRAEREAAGESDATLDRVVVAARRDEDGTYRVPQAESLHRRMVEAVATMIEPLVQGGAVGGADNAAEPYRRRLEALLVASTAPADERLTGGYVDSVTAARREAGDSLHLLVMDLHREINRLQAGLAEEVIGGARVYGLAESDRPRVEAFAAGVQSTAPLKFDHPGLATTATRSDGRLVLQNDIGTTDAHLLVVHVEGLAVTVTYTDIHLARAEFFQSLFGDFALGWEDLRARRAEGLPENESYFLCLGRFAADSVDEVDRFLRHLGSRLVFLIDWNRARKRLRPFLKKPDAVRLLRWAAEAGHGHRAFLELGGERLIFQAIEEAAKGAPRLGEALHEVLGRESAVEYLKFVFRTAAEGLLEGRSARLIRDQIKAELVNYFETAEEHLMALAAQHAALVFEIACAVRDGLLAAPSAAGGGELERAARRAKRWERRADELVVETRTLVRRSPGSGAYQAVIEAADDAADNLEESAFLLSLLPGDGIGSPHLFAPLQELASLVVLGCQELIKGLESGRHVHRGSARQDVQDFLAAVDRLVTVEQQTDEATRRVTAAAVAGASDFRQLHLWSELTRSLEEGADALARSGLILRDHLLNEVMAG